MLIPKRFITLRPWQQEVYNMGIGEPDPDHIIWVYNVERNLREKELFNYILDNVSHTDVYAINDINARGHEEFNIIKAFDSKWSGKLFIIDLFRSQWRISFYDEILKIKNYVNHDLNHRVQNVIILTNSSPNPNHIDLNKLHVYRFDTTTLYRMIYDNEWIVIGG